MRRNPIRLSTLIVAMLLLTIFVLGLGGESGIASPIQRAAASSEGLGGSEISVHFLSASGTSESQPWTEEELLATDFQTITHPDDLEADLSLAGQLMRGEIDFFHMEKRYVHKQGHVIWILLSVSIVRDDASDPCYFIGQIQDVVVFFSGGRAIEGGRFHGAIGGSVLRHDVDIGIG